MATKSKKGLKGSIDGVLADLLGEDDVTSSKSPAHAEVVAGRLESVQLRSGKKSVLTDDFFSKLAEEAGRDEVRKSSNFQHTILSSCI
nr:PREDICTED: fas-binding factor 1 homolog [Latimeria chalumnae]|eukprot:XP_014342279.1 PREDICTED: fas-binding factor 1 homolog [Latimeria chalumnae]